MRAAILREANRNVTRGRAGRRLAVPVFAGLMAAAMLFAVVRWQIHVRALAAQSASRSAAPGLPIEAPPTFTVDADGVARLATRASGATTIIALEDGRASFEVAHLEPGQRFLVALPDGEVEVRGTRFAVDVSTNATRTVTVASGRVVLRLAGQEEVVLVAGEHWPLPVAVDDAQDSAGRRAAPLAAASSAHVAASKPHAKDPGERFDAAMGRFGAGRYAEADQELAAFVRDYPADPRSEDARFLRAVVRSRLGDAQGASALAADYLRAYPRGLRRAEAQHLVDAVAH